MQGRSPTTTVNYGASPQGLATGSLGPGRSCIHPAGHGSGGLGLPGLTGYSPGSWAFPWPKSSRQLGWSLAGRISAGLVKGNRARLPAPAPCAALLVPQLPEGGRAGPGLQLAVRSMPAGPGDSPGGASGSSKGEEGEAEGSSGLQEPLCPASLLPALLLPRALCGIQEPVPSHHSGMPGPQPSTTSRGMGTVACLAEVLLWVGGSVVVSPRWQLGPVGKGGGRDEA